MKQILIHFLDGKNEVQNLKKSLSNLAEDEIIPKPRSVKLHLKTQQIHVFRSRNKGFPGGLAVKNLLAIQETQVQSLGSGRSPRKGSGNSLQYSCLENPMDREPWQATVHEGHKSQTQLSD